MGLGSLAVREQREAVMHRKAPLGAMDGKGIDPPQTEVNCHLMGALWTAGIVVSLREHL